jgi:hypothetical protein
MSNTGCTCGDWLITRNLAGRCPLLRRFGESRLRDSGSLNSRVLDRDHTLIGEGLQQLDLFVLNGRTSSGERDRADAILSKHGAAAPSGIRAAR